MIQAFKVIDNRIREEADIYEIALTEDWTKDLMYMDIKCFALEEDGTLFLMDKCGNFAYCPPDRFTVVLIGDDGMWVNSNQIKTIGCRGITCEQCWNEEADE